MNKDLYSYLIKQGLSEEFARKTAMEFVQVTKEPKAKKDTLASWTSRYSDADIKTRLQAIMSLLSVLGVSVSTEMIRELREFQQEELELLRRLGQLTESKWIPQRDLGGKLAALAKELTGGDKSVSSTTPVPDEVDALLGDLAVVTAEPDEPDEDEEQEITDEDEEVISHIVGIPVVPTFDTSNSEVVDLDKFM